MPILIILVVIVLLAWIYNGYKKQINSINSQDHFTFEEMQFSTQEFYTLTEAYIFEKKIPSLKIGRIEHSVKDIFSAKREYLRVQYKEYFFDICAAPFAKDFFVSWRQGELNQVIQKKRKSFYEQDTEVMFKESIRLCVKRAIDRMVEKRGLRMNAGNEMQLLQ